MVPPPAPSSPLVVEFLDFSSNPLEEANDLEVPQTERELAEIEPAPPREPPAIETQAKIFEKIEQKPPPDVSLNDLIQEEESEKLSMELLPPSQKRGSQLPPTAPAQKQEEPPKSLASQIPQETPPGQTVVNAPPVPSENTSLAEPSPAKKILSDLIKPPQEARESISNSKELPAEAIVFPEKDATEETFPTVAMVAPKNDPRAPSSPSQKGALPQNYFLKNPEKKESPAQKPLVEPTKNFSISSLLPENFPSLSQENAGENSALDSPFPQVPIGQTHSTGMSYGLNDYNWPYEPYMGRWAKALLYSWNNHPPRDYVTGQVLGGGTVFVLVTLNLEGALTSYEVTRVEGASAMMVTSVLNAIQGASNLPPLPADFEKEELTVHFKFIYPSLYHLLRRNR